MVPLTEKRIRPLGFHSLLTEGELGCLMLDFEDADAFKIIDWGQKNIPEEVLDPSKGREREVHVTIAYGFHNTVSVNEIKPWLPYPIPLTLGKISRFRNDVDVIKVEVHSPVMEKLHYALRKHFGPKLEVSFPEFKPHLTLAYVQSGACPALDGNDYFSWQRFIGRSFTYSTPTRSSKTKFTV